MANYYIATFVVVETKTVQLILEDCETREDAVQRIKDYDFDNADCEEVKDGDTDHIETSWVVKTSTIRAKRGTEP